MPINKSYERAKQILSRKDNGITITISNQRELAKFEDFIDRKSSNYIELDKEKLINNIVKDYSEQSLSDAKWRVQKTTKDLQDANKRKEKLIKSEGENSPQYKLDSLIAERDLKLAEQENLKKTPNPVTKISVDKWNSYEDVLTLTNKKYVKRIKNEEKQEIIEDISKQELQQ